MVVDEILLVRQLVQLCGVDTVIIDKFGCFIGIITTLEETIAWYRYELQLYTNRNRNRKNGIKMEDQ